MFTGGIPQHQPLTDTSFSDLGLGDDIVRALDGIGFEHPTPVQAQVIRPAIEGRDIVGLAQTGSGKTAGFCLPIVERLLEDHEAHGLVVCPTREIALQTHAFLEAIGDELELFSTCLIGGVPIGPQERDLRDKPDFIVATPGRLLDHSERGNVDLRTIRHLVLDEADHMLDIGFLPQVMRILEAVPEKRQTMMFSATMSSQIESLARRFMREPEIVDLRSATRTAEGIEHRLYIVEPDDMRAVLMALADEEKGSMLVFTRRKIDAEWACHALAKAGHPVERIHSDRSQKQRVAALKGLREGQHSIIIATNIAARGIDIPIIEHIVNFQPPDRVDDYVHRAGRTARGAMKGTVSTIATWLDKEMIRSIENAVGEPLPRCEVEGVKPYVERKTTIRGRQRVRRRLL